MVGFRNICKEKIKGPIQKATPLYGSHCAVPVTGTLNTGSLDSAPDTGEPQFYLFKEKNKCVRNMLSKIKEISNEL